MTQELSEFIASIRLSDSIEHERFLIKSEQADIRSYIRQCDPDMRPRIVAKMLFLSILGENVAYGQIEAITLMSDDRFSYKRIGYLATSVILDEASDVTVLITHTITKDMQSHNPRVQCLALGLLSNIGSAEMCQNAAAEVLKLTESSHAAVMKRAAMAAVRIVQRIPEHAEMFRPVVSKLLKHGAHGVVIAAINLMATIVYAQPALAASWVRYVPPFTKILSQLNHSRPSREFAFTVFNDPFLQIRVMKILAVLNRPSDDLDDVLEAIATGVDIKRNTGRALLFQAVETIVATAKKPSLRGLAFSQVGRLFQFREANVLYSALSVFSRVLYAGREIVGRTSGDSIALQRYKTKVVRCLSHRDGSIRRRALDVVSALVDENNVETLIPEVLDYVKLADSEFRVELVAKIFTAVQRFAPSAKWNFDTVHRLLIDNGNYVGNDIITAFCKLITRTPELQQYAVRQLSASMLNFSETETLIQVSAWVVGEFEVKDDGAFDTLKRLLIMPQTTNATKGYIITALAKLAARFRNIEPVTTILEQLKSERSLDVQQRAYEMSMILNMADAREEILAPVDANTGDGREKNVVVNVEDDEGDAGDLLLLIDDAPAPKATQKATRTAGDDLLGLDLSIPTTQTPAQPAPPKQITPPPGAIEAMVKSDYTVYFEIRKNPQNPKQMAIRASIFNTGSVALNNFVIKFGVPVGWYIQTQPASGSKLEPIGGPPIFQQLMVYTQGDTPLMMKTQMTYVYGSQPIVENGEISPSVFA